MVSFLYQWVFLQGFFLHRTTLLFLYNHFEHLFAKKKLKINCPFCMGYRLTKMVDFQSGLIPRMFGIFARGFLHRTTLLFMQNRFQHVFGKKKCKLNCPFCVGYKLTKTVDFQNGLISQIFGVSASGFLYRRTLLFLRQSTIIALECRNVTNKAFWKNASFPPLLTLLHFDFTKNGNVSPVTLRGERGFVQVPSTEGQRTPWTSLNESNQWPNKPFRPQAVRNTSGTVFPNTDRPRPANNVFIFSSVEYFVSSFCVEFSLQPFSNLVYVCV